MRNHSVDELWLGVLQQISARAAHELKGVLNGVAVNLEVVRSRSEKSGASAAAVGSFATSASDQFQVVVDMTDALLTLARAPREPIEVGETVKRLAAVLAPSARAEGGSLRLDEPSADAAKGIKVRGNAVRLAVGAALLAALQRKGDVRCRIQVGDETVVNVQCADADASAAFELSPEIVTAASGAGVKIRVDEQAISLAFPRAGAARQRTHETA
jgi:signal transduction histidine kinase